MKNPLEGDAFRKISQTRRDLVVIFIVAIVVFSLSVAFPQPFALAVPHPAACR